MTSKIIDFDAFRAEQKQEPILFTIGGVTYDLPASIPASIAIEVIAMQKINDSEDDVPLELLQDVGIATFGPAIWKEVLEKHRIQLDELPALIGMVLQAYSSGVKDPADPPAAST